MTALATPVLDVRVVPVEAEPLAHFLPGTSVLHVLAPAVDALAIGRHTSADLVHAAHTLRCASIALPHDTAGDVLSTLDDLFHEVRGAGLRWIAVTDGAPRAAATLARQCDAVVVETSGALPAWVEPLVDDQSVWVEIVARLSPDRNDGDASIHDLSSWVIGHLGQEVPVHFAATPDEPVPTASLRRARSIALGDGLHYVYTAPVSDQSSGTTLCPGCGEHLVERDGPQVVAYRLTPKGRCHACGTLVAGRFSSVLSGRAAVVSLAPD